MVLFGHALIQILNALVVGAIVDNLSGNKIHTAQFFPDIEATHIQETGPDKNANDTFYLMYQS